MDEAETQAPVPVTGPEGVPELRVHGVGGSHGPRMLGFESSAEVTVVGEGVGGTRVLTRRRDPSVESYDWGDLTSGSGTRSLWIILLPFTLLNIAGWMHPPVARTSPARVVLVRVLVHVLSVLLTATYVFSFGILLVDLIGWQWFRRLALPTNESSYAAGAPPLASTVDTQRIGMFLGLLALLAVVVVMMYLAGRSQVRFEKSALSPEVGAGLTGEDRWGDDERLSSKGFFFHPTAANRRVTVHRWIVGVSWGLVAAWSLYRAYIADLEVNERLNISNLLGPCSLAALLAIGVLFVVSWGNGRRPGERWVRCAPAIAATISFALVNAVFSGAILLLLKRLNDAPKRPDGAPGLQAGPEVNIVDAWGFIVLVLGGVALVIWARLMFLRPADDVDDRSAAPGRPLDGADAVYRKDIAKSRFLADLAKKGGGVALALAGSLVVTDAVVVIHRSLLKDPDSLFLPAPTAAELDSLLYRVGAYVLPALVLVFVQIVRKSQGGARTVASTLWDVLTFWPRRFSPFAVRPYSERAVPELQGRVARHLVERDSRLLLSVHSQGSILAFAALAPLPAERLGNVALVTYGSPIRTIYATFFPAYFGAEEVEALRAKLPSPGDDLLGWRNFYRRTDPIGGPVFDASGGSPSEPDCLLDDPHTGRATPSEALTEAPLEHDRPAWSQLAVHSYYLQEPELKRWVRDVRVALDEQSQSG